MTLLLCRRYLFCCFSNFDDELTETDIHCLDINRHGISLHGNQQGSLAAEHQAIQVSILHQKDHAVEHKKIQTNILHQEDELGKSNDPNDALAPTSDDTSDSLILSPLDSSSDDMEIISMADVEKFDTFIN